MVLDAHWFQNWGPAYEKELQLFCFPYAAGSARAFRTWARWMPPQWNVIGVQYPGRENRGAESLAYKMSELAEPLVELFLSETRPYMFFGHSLGALLAFEVTERLVRAGCTGPCLLVVSAAAAPHLRPVNNESRRLSRTELLALLRTLNGTDAEVFEHVELLELILPIFAADATIAGRYHRTTDARIPSPLLVLGGKNDTCISLPQLEAWREHTSGTYAQEIFDGDHFFIRQAEEQVVKRILETFTGLEYPQEQLIKP